MKKLTTTLGLALLAGLTAAALQGQAGIGAAQSATALFANTASPTAADSSQPILPLPRQIQLDGRKVELGRRLFHDPQLSKDNSVSCASCHDLGLGGTDNARSSTGVGGAQTAVNSPTVLNSGFNFVQFWDGRAASLEEQIDGPIHHPGEMASSWPEIIVKLSQDPGYAANFKAIYGAGPTAPAIKDAIATFERSLFTPNARFDRYLRGETGILTAEEKRGYELFTAFGCVSCHQGRNVGGNMYQRLGVVLDYFEDRGNISQADYGRYNVTGDEEDLHVFKVPSLRNVELTAPYFHDGSVDDLGSAVQIMARYQLGLVLGKQDLNAVVAFLRTLTGEIPGAVQ